MSYPKRWPDPPPRHGRNSRLTVVLAGLRYQRMRWQARWRLMSFRCPGCPKVWLGPHKFGCYKPGPLPSMRKIRRMDREGI